MIERRYCCDKCGSIILEDRTLLRVESGPLSGRWPDGIDVCRDCLGSWLVPAIRAHAATPQPTTAACTQ